ncbi:MAG: hypothetical protein M3R59_06270 [Verrucomicrobiota bacterium]|nr:hypothetical protein [Verrucomicrobiota bacterium]
MNELVAMVVQRTGMSQEDAQKAVQAVIDVLKEKLPAPIASHIDSLLTGGAGGLEAEAGDMIKGALGGFFNKK